MVYWFSLIKPQIKKYIYVFYSVYIAVVMYVGKGTRGMCPSINYISLAMFNWNFW